MLRLLGFLWTGCFHKWVIDNRRPLSVTWDADSPPDRGERVAGHCERCGKPKKWDLI